MKTTRLAILTLGALVGAASGCREPTQPESVSPPVVPNTAPKAFAGPDLWVPIPSSEAVLSGRATDQESHVIYSWTKIAGPDAYSIEDPKSSRTKAVRLEKGRYGFELTATDKGGLSGKDTVGVSVYDPRVSGKNEFVFVNLGWLCPMGCHLTIEKFSGYIPYGTPIRVFLSPAKDGNWVEAKPEGARTGGDRYGYSFTKDGLSILAEDELGEVNVRIVF